jgi:hypothetical protein
MLRALEFGQPTGQGRHTQAPDAVEATNDPIRNRVRHKWLRAPATNDPIIRPDPLFPEPGQPAFSADG